MFAPIFVTSFGTEQAERLIKTMNEKFQEEGSKDVRYEVTGMMCALLMAYDVKTHKEAEAAREAVAKILS